MNLPEQSTVLSSWKDIARYMGKGVRTVQRWERELGLPVKRPNGASQKSAVLLDRSEVDSWLKTRFSARPSVKNNVPAVTDSSRSARSVLRESVRAARDLRYANLVLTQQISQSLRLLTKHCDALNNQILAVPGRMPDVAGAGAEWDSMAWDTTRDVTPKPRL